jgi:hypothetical protein
VALSFQANEQPQNRCQGNAAYHDQFLGWYYMFKHFLPPYQGLVCLMPFQVRSMMWPLVKVILPGFNPQGLALIFKLSTGRNGNVGFLYGMLPIF